MKKPTPVTLGRSTSPPTRNSAAFRNALKQRLVDVGEGVIENQGLNQLKARHVANLADCAVGSIYNVFEDLDGLIIAINSRTLSRLGEALHTSHEQSASQPTPARLLSLATTYFEFAKSNLRLWHAIFDHQLPENRQAPPQYRADQDALFALVEDILKVDIVEPQARASAARALFASVHGIVALSLDRKLAEFNNDLTMSQIRFLITTIANGLEKT